MHLPRGPRIPTGSFIFSVIVELIPIGMLLALGLVALAASALSEVATLVLGTTVEGLVASIAALTELVATLAVFLLAVMVMMLLQSPLWLAPFGPLAEVIRFGLGVWSGHDGN